MIVEGYIMFECTMGKKFTFWLYLTTLGTQVEAGRRGNRIIFIVVALYASLATGTGWG